MWKAMLFNQSRQIEQSTLIVVHMRHENKSRPQMTCECSSCLVLLKNLSLRHGTCRVKCEIMFSFRPCTKIARGPIQFLFTTIPPIPDRRKSGWFHLLDRYNVSTYQQSGEE